MEVNDQVRFTSGKSARSTRLVRGGGGGPPGKKKKKKTGAPKTEKKI